MNKQTPGDQISVKEFLQKLREWYAYMLSKWMLILLAAIIGASLGFGYSYFKKPIYIGYLSFALEDEQQDGLSGALGLVSQFGFDLGESGGGIFSGANLIELFKSRTMVEQTLLKPVSANGQVISFAEMYIRSAEWRDEWAKKPAAVNLQFPPNADRSKFTRAQDSILGIIYTAISRVGLKVEQKDKNVDIITIEMQSDNEYFAKYFAESLATEVSNFYIQTKSRKARLNMTILEKQTDSIRNELNSAISGVASANDQTFNLNPALNVRRVPSARRQVDVQANTAILTELVKQTELARVTLRKETPLIQVIDRPILPLKKEKTGKLKGMVLGSLLASIVVILILLLRRGLKNLSRE